MKKINISLQEYVDMCVYVKMQTEGVSYVTKPELKQFAKMYDTIFNHYNAAYGLYTKNSSDFNNILTNDFKKLIYNGTTFWGIKSDLYSRVQKTVNELSLIVKKPLDIIIEKKLKKLNNKQKEKLSVRKSRFEETTNERS